LYQKKLFLFEFKYRAYRLSQEKNAFNCLRFRSYSERFLNHLKTEFFDIFNKIDEVFEVGIGFSIINSEIEVGMIMETGKLFQLIIII